MAERPPPTHASGGSLFAGGGACYKTALRPPMLLVALSIGACQPSPVSAESAPAVTEQRGDPPRVDPVATVASPQTIVDPSAPTVPVPTPAAKPGVVVAHRELPEALVDRLKVALPDHTAACDILRRAPCGFEGDLDGDGLRDEVVLVRDDRRQRGIAVLWGKGGAELIGAGRRDLYWKTTEVANIDGTPNDPPGRERVDANITWIEAWDLWPLRRKGRGYAGRVARSTHRFGAPGALGDGLMLSGSDAAVVVYRTKRGWTQMHLGF